MGDKKDSGSTPPEEEIQDKELGRPTKYNPDYDAMALKACQLGAIDTDLADFFNVDIATIYRWKINNPTFCEAIKEGKADKDDRVERSLLERAVGYSHREDKIFHNDGVTTTVETVKHYPPDPTSMIFWLKNRRPGAWRDKRDIEHTGNVSIVASELDEDI